GLLRWGGAYHAPTPSQPCLFRISGDGLYKINSRRSKEKTVGCGATRPGKNTAGAWRSDTTPLTPRGRAQHRRFNSNFGVSKGHIKLLLRLSPLVKSAPYPPAAFL